MTREEETAERNACDEWWHAQPNKGASIQEAWVERARRAGDARYTMDQMRDYAEAFHKSRVDANEHKFAIIKGRHYDGEGLTLWAWDGRYYCGTDGDCLLPHPDGSLDGFDCEWLTLYQLEQRLNGASSVASKEETK